VIATAKKRVAQTLHPGPLWGEGDAATRGEARRALEEARRHYREISLAGQGAAWAAVQVLSLTAALEADPLSLTAPTFADRWTAAYVVAEDNLHMPDPQRVIWAHSNLVELYVLAQLLPADHGARGAARARAFEHLDHLLAIAGEFDVYSLRRQLLRFADWWWRDRPDLRALPSDLARMMMERGVSRAHRERR
jgi:hypothetical protein